MGEEHPLHVARCTKIIKGSITLAAEAAEAARAAGPPSATNGSATEQNGAAGGSGGSGASGPPGGFPGMGSGGLPGGLAGALGGGERRPNADEEDKYVINIKQVAKYVVGLSDKVASTDIEEGMRVG